MGERVYSELRGNFQFQFGFQLLAELVQEGELRVPMFFDSQPFVERFDLGAKRFCLIAFRHRIKPLDIFPDGEAEVKIETDAG